MAPSSDPDPSAPTVVACQRPGSAGEHRLQAAYGTERRAQSFYDHQVVERLNARMQSFIAAQEMVFVSSADAAGNCDCSVRVGPPGFVRVLSEQTLAYPEYRGNGVMASLGNLTENPHIGLLFVDFFVTTVGCHVNGRARVVENDTLLGASNEDDEELQALRREAQAALADPERGRRPERWVLVHVEEAYIHCSKHLPRLTKADKAMAWGSDDPAAKGGDFFGVRELPDKPVAGESINNMRGTQEE